LERERRRTILTIFSLKKTCNNNIGSCIK